MWSVSISSHNAILSCSTTTDYLRENEQFFTIDCRQFSLILFALGRNLSNPAQNAASVVRYVPGLLFFSATLCPSLLKSKIQTEQERGHTWQIWASEECWNTHLTFSCNYISVRTQMPKLWQTAQSLCWWMRKIHCVHVLRVKQLCSAPHSFTSNFKKIYPLEISTDIKTSNAC